MTGATHFALRPTSLHLQFAARAPTRDNPEMEPKFSEMNKVRVTDGENEPYEGYVIDSLFRDGRWLYKLSISENPKTSDTSDNWAPEEWLQKVK